VTVDAATLEHRYIAHGLALIRVSNALAKEVDGELVKLMAAVRSLLLESALTGLSRRVIARVLRILDEEIRRRYATIADHQLASLEALIAIEAEFAVRASGFTRELSPASLTAVQAGLLVLGAVPRDAWMKQAGDTSWRVASEVRAALAAGADEMAVIARVVGSGPRGRERGGVMDIARRQARALVDTSVHSAATEARLAAFRTNGVQAVRWHAILDAKVCPACAVHAGKLYSLAGKPIGHALPLGQPPPAHWWCRCILLPMKFPNGLPAEGGTTANTFAAWLDTLAPYEQAAVLGKGRADLWRRGVITLSDLIHQSGRLLTLGELRALVRQ